MYYYLYNLAAKDPEGIFDIAIPVIIILFWVGGAIVKFLTKKGQEQPGQETKPATKQQYTRTRAVKEQGRPLMEKRAYTPRPEREFRPAKKLKQVQKKPTYSVLEEAKSGAAAMGIKLPEVIQKVKPLSVGVTGIMDMPEEILPASSGLISISDTGYSGVSAARELLSFEGPDDLRRAILGYEILGKPVALRDMDF